MYIVPIKTKLKRFYNLQFESKEKLNINQIVPSLRVSSSKTFEFIRISPKKGLWNVFLLT